MVLWSTRNKKIVVIVLTVPWEDRCCEANERKRTMYDELLAQWKEVGKCGASQWR